MNGYQYLIARNRLMQKLEADLGALATLPPADRETETHRLQTVFDLKLAALYAQVATEYPGERKKKARPIADPR
ncbi:MAG: hypothetical protein JWM69_189 [Candidatus Binatus sp.]|jgi:hypothetical protein|nr:hypothetical protein [Candidatus Binatus sp.]